MIQRMKLNRVKKRIEDARAAGARPPPAPSLCVYSAADRMRGASAHRKPQDSGRELACQVAEKLLLEAGLWWRGGPVHRPVRVALSQQGKV